MLSPDDIRRWQKYTEERLCGDPALAEALRDPARVFNFDEVSIPTGVDKRKVVALKGTAGSIPNLAGGNAKERTTSAGLLIRHFIEIH